MNNVNNANNANNINNVNNVNKVKSGIIYFNKVNNFNKSWLPSAKLKQTFTFLGKDFAIFNTFTWENPYQEK